MEQITLNNLNDLGILENEQWKKESNKKNALYKDLCPEILEKVPLEEIMEYYEGLVCRLYGLCDHDSRSKNNDNAVKLRYEGNLLFEKSQIISAIEKYNQSLCFAVNGSEHIALAYANRAICYSELEMHKECLIDIDLAKKAKYPKHLLPTLEKRREACLKAITDGKQSKENVPKLSYEPHEQFPGLANILSVKFDRKNGRHIITKKDLNIGETIMMEPIYFGETIDGKYEECSLCLKSNVNLVPCPTCTDVLICYNRCENSYIHEIECGAAIHEHPLTSCLPELSTRTLVIRSILMANELFPNVDDLIEFVEKTITGNYETEIPSFINKYTQYRAFLSCYRKENNYSLRGPIYHNFNTLIYIPEIGTKFTTEKYRRFLKQLIGHHSSIFDRHRITSMNYYNTSEMCGSVSFGILKSFFNCSCTPNIMIYSANGTNIARVIQPIKAGEQLLMMPVLTISDLCITHQKQLQLIKMPCTIKCGVCHRRVEGPIQSNPLMASDPDFLCTETLRLPHRTWIDEKNLEIYENHCVAFLSKFGRKKHCIELGAMKIIYADLLKRHPFSIFTRYREILSYDMNSKCYLK